MRPTTGLALLFAAAGALASTDWDTAGKSWWAHVRFLADDKLEGRDVGSAGFETAADYVVRQFERAGLQPGAGIGYSQPVSFTKVTLDESDSKLTLLGGSAAAPVKLGEEALITSTMDVADLEAPLVFAGYGLDIPEANYSDLKGPELNGAVVVYLNGGPANIATELRSHHSAGTERAVAMRAAGVLGTIAIPDPRSMDIPWTRQRANRLLPHMSLSDPAFAGRPGLALTATWNPENADLLFTGSGHTIREILEAADYDRPLPHFTLKRRLRARVAVRAEKVESRNVAGVRPGSGPALKNQSVIVSAHLDHLGVGEKIAGDGIFNGAMDDASGVASLIEIARTLNARKAKTRRSVVFLAVTGEEKGLLGSNYFAQFPTAPGRMVADINIDMFLPLFPLRFLEVQGLNESTLGDDIRAAAKAANVMVQADQDPAANRFIRSDQYSFIRRGVPALAFKFGWLPGTPEEKIYRAWYRDRYHAVGDDLSQPVDLNGATQFDAILASLIERIANSPNAPHWKPHSYFRQFAK
ncbi:MAG: M20/M25/M40 family metallo-hydrolase [Acidobacteriota bacterium]|nr:M20/M25/M40 family metallo-hydrolase [Acidobacteriota bacterium]